MDNSQLKQIFYQDLDRYKTKVDNIQKKYEDKEGFGYGHYLSSPIINRMLLLWIIDYLNEHGVDTHQLIVDFKKVDNQLMEFKENNIAKFYDDILRDFKKLAQNYEPSSIIVDNYEFEHEIERRTYIEMFFQELKGIFNLDKDMEEIRRLDDEFRKMIPEAIKAKTYCPLDHPYIPREYWWRHLEDVYGKYEYDSINDKLIPVK